MTSKNINGSLTCTYWSSLFVSRNYDPVYWDADDPNIDNLSVFVSDSVYLFLGIMILYTGTLLILIMLNFQCM
jgi:hypothetical protein